MSSWPVSFAVAVLLLAHASPSAASSVLLPPVDAAATVRFTEPPHEWGPGHRGIDYAVPAGTRVRAAAAGTVSFAGPVARRLAVTIDHGRGYETTYTALGDVSVAAGDVVSQGEWIGSSDVAHPGGQEGVHFGAKFDGSYVDPAPLFGDLDLSDAIRLAPLVWQPPREMPEAFRSAFADAGTSERLCRRADPLSEYPELAPNENVAVAIAGIGSSTQGGVSADMYEHGPEELGYAPDRIVHFSYAGPSGRDLHRPYASTDTFGNIADAAQKLLATLRRVALRHPGRDVDLIAHSMGGLVARSMLTELEGPSGVPQIEHLVTFATPHAGASVAAIPKSLETKTLTGGFLVDGASAWARAGGPVPDPRSEAVAQLAPGSPFLSDLARESVAYGTRVLALGIANDVVVTADRARWDGERSRTVAPAGLMGHSSIVSSPDAQGLAYAFLRDGPPSCGSGWDLWGPRLGRAAGVVEENSFRALAAAEELAVGRVLRVGKLVDRYVPERFGRVARKLAGKLLHRTGVVVSSRL